MRPTPLATRVLPALLASAVALHADDPPSEKLSNAVARARGETTARMDWLHERVNRHVDLVAARLDTALGVEGQPLEPRTNSHLRVRLLSELRKREGEGAQWRLRPDVDADASLPNLEHRLHVFVNQIAPGDLPGRTPTDRTTAEGRKLFVGLRHLLDRDWFDFGTRAGVKGGWPPEVFTEASVRRCWAGDTWLIEPAQTGFWSSDEQFGAKTSLRVDRWLGDRVAVQSASAARRTEETDGIAWQEVATLTHIKEGTLGDAHRSIGLQATFGGRYDHGTAMELYRVDVPWRLPVYRRWLYLRIAPRVEWNREHDWAPTYAMLGNIELLFWGGEDR